MSNVVNGQYLPTNDAFEPIAVPATMRMNALPVPMSGIVTDRYVSSTSSTSVTSGQLISFEIPNIDCLMPGTVYLRGTVSGKATVAATSDFILSSISDVIRRVETRIGGATVDSISDYNKIYSVLKLANCPLNYAEFEGSILELMGKTCFESDDANTYGTTYEFCIPLISGLLTTGRALPLFLMSSPLVVNIELESASNVNSAAGFEFKIDNPRLYYQTCDMGADYVNKLWAELPTYGGIKIPFTTFSSSLYGLSAGGTLSVQIGEKASSVLGVLIARQLTGEKGDLYKVNGFEYLDVSIDGRAFPSYRQESAIHCQTEVGKIFSHLFDTDHTGQIKRSTLNNHFLCGASTVRFHEGNLSMVGSPVSNRIDVTLKGNTDASTAYVFTIKQYGLLISPTGERSAMVTIST